MPSQETLLHVGVEIGRLHSKQEQTHTLLDTRTAAMQRSLDQLILALRTSTQTPPPSIRTGAPTAIPTLMDSTPTGTPPMGTMGPTDSLIRRFGPKALAWALERAISWLLPYLLPIALIVWSKGWAWVELVARFVRQALGA